MTAPIRRNDLWSVRDAVHPTQVRITDYRPEAPNPDEQVYYVWRGTRTVHCSEQAFRQTFEPVVEGGRVDA